MPTVALALRFRTPISHHITINGQTYASVDEMPPEIRREYEMAMQLIAKKAAAPIDTSAADVNVFTTRRIVLNGKRYSRWEDVPSKARAALQSTGVASQIPDAPAAKQISISSPPNYDSSTTISLSLVTLVILFIIALLVGLCIGIVIGHTLLH